MKVAIVDGAAVLQTVPVPEYSSGLQAWLRRHFPGTNDCVRVPADQIALSNRSQLTQTCLFTAVAEYARSLLGISLCDDDRRFYTEHPLVETSGCPRQHTLRVVQELVAPYDLRVSRVRLPKGVSVFGDLAQWQRVLGVNPLALSTRAVTNEEFCQQTGYDPAAAAQRFRFEFCDEVLKPSVTCGAMPMVALHGLERQQSDDGHAQYCSPRGSAAPPLLQFQLDRSERVCWHSEPVFPSLPPRPLEVDLWRTRNKTGQTYLDSIEADWNGWSPRKTCGVCGKSAATMIQDRVCQSCWRACWAPYTCWRCKASFRRRAPTFSRATPESVEASCLKCGSTNTLSKDDPGIPALIACLSESQQGFWW